MYFLLKSLQKLQIYNANTAIIAHLLQKFWIKCEKKHFTAARGIKSFATTFTKNKMINFRCLGMIFFLNYLYLSFIVSNRICLDRSGTKTIILVPLQWFLSFVMLSIIHHSGSNVPLKILWSCLLLIAVRHSSSQLHSNFNSAFHSLWCNILFQRYQMIKYTDFTIKSFSCKLEILKKS